MDRNRSYSLVVGSTVNVSINSTDASYVFSPNLGDFDTDILGPNFIDHFQFFRINAISVEATNQLPYGGVVGTSILNAPQICMVPYLNADVSFNFDTALATFGNVNGVL